MHAVHAPWSGVHSASLVDSEGRLGASRSHSESNMSIHVARCLLAAWIQYRLHDIIVVSIAQQQLWLAGGCAAALGGRSAQHLRSPQAATQEGVEARELMICRLTHVLQLGRTGMHRGYANRCNIAWS